MYDASIGRFASIDRFAEKYQQTTSYHYTLNNPILYIDVNGDSVDVNNLREGNRVAYFRLQRNLEEETGLILSADEDGNLSYATEKGFLGIKRAKISKTGKTSRLARRSLKKAIKDKGTVEVIDNTGGSSFVQGTTEGQNKIFFDIEQIQSFIDGTSKDLNPNTYGVALNFFHELGHTKIGGGDRDDWDNNDPQPQTTIGPNVKRVNRMRRQLGRDYGQRTGYGDFRHGNTIYLPWSANTKQRLLNGKAPKKRYIIKGISREEEQ